VTMKGKLERKKSVDNQLKAGNYNFDELVCKPSLRVWFIYAFIFIAALSIKFYFMVDEQHFELLWRSIVSAGVIYLGYLYLMHVTTSYTVNVLEVIGHSGVFSRKVVRIPLNRITNYECRTSFVERVLGLSNVMIDTPGGASFELIMARLLKHDSDNIVEHLRYLMGQQKVSDAGSNVELKSLREQALWN